MMRNSFYDPPFDLPNQILIIWKYKIIYVLLLLGTFCDICMKVLLHYVILFIFKKKQVDMTSKTKRARLYFVEK